MRAASTIGDLARGPTRRGIRIRIAASILLFCVALAAGTDLLREHAVAVSRRDLTGSARAVSGGATRQIYLIEPGVPRALVNRALLSARQAAALPPGSQRNRILDAARWQAERAVAARPFWAEALVTAAYVYSLADASRDQRRSAELLAASYVGAPFLRDAGTWRIGYALDHWQAIAGPTRNSVIEESLWLAGVDPMIGPTILEAVRNSAAAAPFLARSRVLTSAALHRAQRRPPD